MSGFDVDDLPRRLSELAESGGPWDDPMPEIRRRSAQSMATDPEPERPPLGPAAARARRRWRSTNPFTIASAAAVVLLVVALGWLIHGAGPVGSSKSAVAGSARTAEVGSDAAGAATSAAGAPARGSSTPRPGAAGGTSAGGTGSASAPQSGPSGPRTSTSTVSVCGWPAASAGVTVLAPSTVRAGAQLSIAVRLGGSAAGVIRAPVIVVLFHGRVVGQLVTTLIPPGPQKFVGAPSGSTEVTGTLGRSTCAQATSGPPGTGSVTAGVLPVGEYELVAAATGPAATFVSNPVSITITR